MGYTPDRNGALGRNRTCDQEIRRLLLYPLSYEGRRPVYRLRLLLVLGAR